MRVSRTMLSHALRIAVEEYRKHGLDCAAIPGHDRLAEQFARQAQEAQDLADSIENGCNVYFVD